MNKSHQSITQRQELVRSMKKHKQALGRLKPKAKDYVESPKKKQKNKNVEKQKQEQIQYENTILTHKIHNVFGYCKPEKQGTHINREKIRSDKQKKSRKKLQQSNKKIEDRIEAQKTNINFKKNEADYLLNRAVLSKHSVPNKKRKSKKQDNPYDIPTKITLKKIIDRTQLQLTLRWQNEKQEKLLIIGRQLSEEQQEQKLQFKVIQIQRLQAIAFIQQECNNHIQDILNHLRYDYDQKTLYLVGSEIISENQLLFSDLQDEEQQQQENNEVNQVDRP